MLSVSYAGKNAYSAGKTSGVLKGGASGANRGYVLAHWPLVKEQSKKNKLGLSWAKLSSSWNCTIL